MFSTFETTSWYFLFGLLTLLDFIRLVVSLGTGSGALTTETLEWLYYYHHMLSVMGFSSSLMICCFPDNHVYTEEASVVLLAGWLVITTGGVCEWLRGLAASLA